MIRWRRECAILERGGCTSKIGRTRQAWQASRTHALLMHMGDSDTQAYGRIAPQYWLIASKARVLAAGSIASSSSSSLRRLVSVTSACAIRRVSLLSGAICGRSRVEGDEWVVKS